MNLQNKKITSVFFFENTNLIKSVQRLTTYSVNGILFTIQGFIFPVIHEQPSAYNVHCARNVSWDWSNYSESHVSYGVLIGGTGIGVTGTCDDRCQG